MDVMKWFGAVPKTPTIHDIPDRAIKKIFYEYIRTEGPVKFFRNVTMVCSRWKELSLDGTLMKEINFESMDWNMEELITLGKRGIMANTKVLDLSTGLKHGKENLKHEVIKPILNPIDFLRIAPYCNEVKYLDISENVIDKHGLEYLTKMWPNVKRLVMGGVTDVKPLVYQNASPENPSQLNPNTLLPVLRNWGKELKYLNLNCIAFTRDEELILKIANSCPSLENFNFENNVCSNDDMTFRCPIDKLQSCCINLKFLKLDMCEFEYTLVENMRGFENLVSFACVRCLYRGLRICHILKTSIELKYLEIDRGVKTMYTIPSTGIQMLKVPYERDAIEHLKKALAKWKHTLREIYILSTNPDAADDITSLVDVFLSGNNDPVLQIMELGGAVNLSVVKELIRCCPRLKRLCFNRNGETVIQETREDVEKVLNFKT